MKKPLEIAWMGPQVGWDRGLEITRVGQRVIDKSMETQLWCPPAGSVGGGRVQ